MKLRGRKGKDVLTNKSVVPEGSVSSGSASYRRRISGAVDPRKQQLRDQEIIASLHADLLYSSNFIRWMIGFSSVYLLFASEISLLLSASYPFIKVVSKYLLMFVTALYTFVFFYRLYKVKGYWRQVFFWLDLFSVLSLIYEINLTILSAHAPIVSIYGKYKVSLWYFANWINTQGGQLLMNIRLVRLLNLLNMVHQSMHSKTKAEAKLHQVTNLKKFNLQCLMDEQSTKFTKRSGSKRRTALLMSHQHQSSHRNSLESTTKRYSFQEPIAYYTSAITIYKVLLIAALITTLLVVIDPVVPQCSRCDELSLLEPVLTTNSSWAVGEINPNLSFLRLKEGGVLIERNTTPLYEATRTTNAHWSTIESPVLIAVFDDEKEFYSMVQLSLLKWLITTCIVLVGTVKFTTDGAELSMTVGGPLSTIAADMDTVTVMNFNETLGLEDEQTREIELIVDSYGRMKKGLASFTKYVPQAILQEIMSQPNDGAGIVKKPVSMMFCDLVDSEDIFDELTGPHIISFMRLYFDKVFRITNEYHGEVIEFVGTTSLALWNAPNGQADHAYWAICAALAIAECIDMMRVPWKKQGFPEVAVRCGLHTGDVYVGSIGSHLRKKYSALGDNVNIASYVHGMTEVIGDAIVISKEMYLQPLVKNTFDCEELAPLHVKGREPIELYEVLGYLDENSNPLKSSRLYIDTDRSSFAESERKSISQQLHSFATQEEIRREHSSMRSRGSSRTVDSIISREGAWKSKQISMSEFEFEYEAAIGLNSIRSTDSDFDFREDSSSRHHS